MRLHFTHLFTLPFLLLTTLASPLPASAEIATNVDFFSLLLSTISPEKLIALVPYICAALTSDNCKSILGRPLNPPNSKLKRSEYVELVERFAEPEPEPQLGGGLGGIGGLFCNIPILGTVLCPGGANGGGAGTGGGNTGGNTGGGIGGGLLGDGGLLGGGLGGGTGGGLLGGGVGI